MRQNYKHTMYASFIGYVVQAIVNNFIPLLFLTFQDTYGIPITKITFLVTFNFGLQLLVDFVSPKIIDKTGYRPAVVGAHLFAAAGLVSLVVLPELCSDSFVGLMVAVLIYAIGGGLIEVLISPIVEACPSDNKEAAMSLLHSFYCWGHVGVVLLSTVFFATFGISSWKVLACLWAIIPLANTFYFTQVPIVSLLEEGEVGMTVAELLKNKVFWIMVVLMICAGACEQAVSQWASTFAELGLGVGKTVGDLAGPMFFATMMGLSRMLYGKFSDKLDLQKAMLGSGILCLFSYLVISFSSYPVLGLLGCGICGFSVGMLWPGTFSMSAVELKRGGTIMFAYLALAGDLGCSLGPTVVGRASGMAGDNLKMGVLSAIVFPVVLILGIVYNKRRKEQQG